MLALCPGRNQLLYPQRPVTFTRSPNASQAWADEAMTRKWSRPSSRKLRMKLCAQLACLPSATSRMMSLLELAQPARARSKTPGPLRSGACNARRRLRRGGLHLDECALRHTLPFS